MKSIKLIVSKDSKEYRLVDGSVNSALYDKLEPAVNKCTSTEDIEKTAIEIIRVFYKTLDVIRVAVTVT